VRVSFLVHLEGLLTVFVRVNRHSVNGSRLDNNAAQRLMSFKRATAIDILTLVITFLRGLAKITT